MDDLSIGLIRLCKHNRDGAISTQKNRKVGLKAIANDLKTLGYELKDVSSLKPKHIVALTQNWHDRDLSKATIRNRLSWVRWWAEKANKASVVERNNVTYSAGRAQIEYTDKAQTLTSEVLNRVPCDHIKAALAMQAAFGLRREEALKFQPHIAIKSDHIALKSSRTKGGRARAIPITNPHQRTILKAVYQLVGKGSLIPPERSYVQHLKHYEYQTAKAKIGQTHGFRHSYAKKRYLVLTGQKCPLAGGKNKRTMTPDERVRDRQARLQISKELGHGRLAITDVYLGKAW